MSVIKSQTLTGVAQTSFITLYIRAVESQRPDERFPFQYSEPRLRRAWKMRLFPFLATAIGVFHYQL